LKLPNLNLEESTEHVLKRMIKGDFQVSIGHLLGIAPNLRNAFAEELRQKRVQVNLVTAKEQENLKTASERRERFDESGS
jgi:hypothetical protein